MRSRTITIVLAVAALALLALCIWRLLYEPGPRLNGKSISSYVKQLTGDDDGTSSQDRWRSYQAAAKALRQMGPPAATWLAQRIERKERPWQRGYRALWQAMPPLARRLMPRPGEAPGPMSSRDFLDGRVLRALAQVGPGAVPILTNYLDASRYGMNTRLQIYNTLTAADLSLFVDALPMLEHNLALTNTDDRVFAAYAIAAIDPRRTEQAVSVLRESLGASHSRDSAVIYLWNLGRAAEAAAPDLEVALSDPDPAFRERARAALQRVTGKRVPRR
jgi:hypothetical protein